jgi:hypothetical protein
MARLIFTSIGIAYIAFWTGWGIALVGQVPDAPLEVYTWKLPFSLFLMTAPPFVLGLFAGLDE